MENPLAVWQMIGYRNPNISAEPFLHVRRRPGRSNSSGVGAAQPVECKSSWFATCGACPNSRQAGIHPARHRRTAHNGLQWDAESSSRSRGIERQGIGSEARGRHHAEKRSESHALQHKRHPATRTRRGLHTDLPRRRSAARPGRGGRHERRRIHGHRGGRRRRPLRRRRFVPVSRGGIACARRRPPATPLRACGHGGVFCAGRPGRLAPRRR